MQQWKKNWRREAQRYWTFQHQTRSANRTAFMLESKPVNWWFEGKNETQYRRKKTNQTKVLTKTPDYREQSVQQNWKRKLSLKRALPFSNCRTANLAERSSIKHYRLHAQPAGTPILKPVVSGVLPTFALRNIKRDRYPIDAVRTSAMREWR